MNFRIPFVLLALAATMISSCGGQEPLQERDSTAQIEENPSPPAALGETAEPVEGTGGSVDQDVTSVVAHDQNTHSVDAAAYQLGNVIDFSAAGNSDLYTRTGWKGTEATHRWMTGQESLLCLRLEQDVEAMQSGAALKCELAVTPFLVPDKIEGQWLEVNVNGNKVYGRTIKKRSIVEFSIPSELLPGDGTLCIEFLHPNGAIPAEVIPDNPDQAILSFRVTSFTISKSEDS